ncbi:MAG: VWA domain-containing protein [Alphaproteobacteria bacterium]|nr:VWA domain-containing protein [Alphaproteobacteria bacterium]MBQ6787672.1 VWA domain-containing protein [Lachnospiraceae bacterium]
MKRGKKILIFVISILVILLIVVNIFLYLYMNQPSKKAKQQLDLGQQYLLSMDYEEAIAAYEIAIELEPKNTEAYLGMAQAYIAMGESQKAIKILKRGYLETEDEEIKELLSELEEEQNREEVDLSIVQIDTSEFPNITVYFSLEDMAGNFIDDVQPEQVKVLESNGTDWVEMSGNIQFTEKDVSKRSVSLVMDTSGSMDGSINDLCWAAQELLTHMQGGNYNVALTTFSNTWNTIYNFTNDISAVSDELNYMYASGGTALYDTLENCLHQAVNQQGQKYILAFTDGLDNDSRIGKDELISLAKYYNVPIYIIAAMEENRTYEMKEIALESGGEFYSLYSMDNLYDVYYEIFQLQENLYSFEYTTMQSNSECGLRVVYESKKYGGESEGDFISQKPIKREMINNNVIVNAESSSALQEHPLENAFDSSENTMWIEGIRGNGIGETIHITLDEMHGVNGITIYNGNRTKSDLYEKYNRIKTIQVTFSDGSQRQFELDDNFYEPCDINFINPVKTNFLEIKILEVYEGTTYQETCITDISIN